MMITKQENLKEKPPLYWLIIFWVLALHVIGSFNVFAEQGSEFTEGTSEYILKFSNEEPSKVLIEAHMRVSKGQIRMASWGHPWLQHGWATFVKNLVATDSSGNEVAASLVEKDGWGAWELPVNEGEVVSLSYEVILEHVNYDWNKSGGQDSRPEWKGGALFAVSKAFFIYSGLDKQSIVKFVLPNSWDLSTPWSEFGSNTSTFKVSSWESLISNMFVIGKYKKYATAYDKMNLVLALDESLEEYAETIHETLQAQLKTYDKIFDGVPDVNFLIGIRSANEDDGEAFHNSFNQVMELETLANSDARFIWGNTLGHEMLHFWIGTYTLKSNDKSNMYWFMEGFTEYYSSLTTYQNDLISQENYLKRLENYLARYFITSNMWPEERVSLKSAGESKHKNWLRIYGGGATIALALDIDIHIKSQGKQSLDDLMRLLKMKYGGTGSYISNDKVLEALNELTGRSYDNFFKEYILTPDGYLDIEPFLSSVGIQALSRVDEFFLTVKDSEKYQAFINRTP